jgi:GxxExxY protein
MEIEDYNRLSGMIINCCIEVHKHMGPGLLEKVYEKCLMKEFELQGIRAQSQVEIPLFYKGYDLHKNFAADIIVEDCIVLELKAVETIPPLFYAQLISYLTLADRKLGLLINFNVPLMKQGIRRFANNLK